MAVTNFDILMELKYEPDRIVQQQRVTACPLRCSNSGPPLALYVAEFAGNRVCQSTHDIIIDHSLIVYVVDCSRLACMP
jgi:hypothetical protein